MVFKACTGELHGYTNNNPEEQSRDEKLLAKHALALYVRGITNSNISCMVAYFGVDSCNGTDLLGILMRAISYLRLLANLHVMVLIGKFKLFVCNIYKVCCIEIYILFVFLLIYSTYNYLFIYDCV